jgi:hypothetical protein
MIFPTMIAPLTVADLVDMAGMNDPKQLQQAIREVYGLEAAHVRSEPVHERFRGELVRNGAVEVFTVTGHPRATHIYAWTYEGHDGKPQHTAVLGVPPINSARDAVTRRGSGAHQKRSEESGARHFLRSLSVGHVALVGSSVEPVVLWDRAQAEAARARTRTAARRGETVRDGASKGGKARVEQHFPTQDAYEILAAATRTKHPSWSDRRVAGEVAKTLRVSLRTAQRHLARA